MLENNQNLSLGERIAQKERLAGMGLNGTQISGSTLSDLVAARQVSLADRLAQKAYNTPIKAGVIRDFIAKAQEEPFESTESLLNALTEVLESAIVADVEDEDFEDEDFEEESEDYYEE